MKDEVGIVGQGGLEVPCRLRFTAGEASIKKISRFYGTFTQPLDPESKHDQDAVPPKKKMKCSSLVPVHSTTRWLVLGNTELSVDDRNIVLSGNWLTDKHINDHTLL